VFQRRRSIGFVYAEGDAAVCWLRDRIAATFAAAQAEQPVAELVR
jgi:hypothetical protein